MGDVVVIQGLGQQGIGCLIASGGRGRGPGDRVRARPRRGSAGPATELGADRVVDVEREDLVEVVEEATGGRLADLAVDTSGAGAPTLANAVAVARKRGTVVLASGSAWTPRPWTSTRSAASSWSSGVRGHSYRAVELALQIVGGAPASSIGSVAGPSAWQTPSMRCGR